MSNLLDSISDEKRKFLASIGIDENNMPESFFDVIVPCRDAFSRDEVGFLSNYHICGTAKERFCIRDVIGTQHDSYAGKTWIESFLSPKRERADKLIQQYFENPKYWEDLKKIDQSGLEHETSIGLAKRDGKYYILSNAGGVNNRIIMMKNGAIVLDVAGDEKQKLCADEIVKMYGDI